MYVNTFLSKKKLMILRDAKSNVNTLKYLSMYLQMEVSTDGERTPFFISETKRNFD